MDNKNIIFNKSIEQYTKKYRNGRYRLLKYTKKEVEQFDKSATNGLKVKNFLLNGRKWALIGDTYYEIPKAPRWTWFRNLKSSTQIISSVLVVGALVAPITLGVYYSLKEDADVKNVNDLNNYISQNNSIKSLFDAVKYIKDNKNINLEEVNAKDSNKEYAFDIDNHEFVLLNKDGNVLYAPKKINKKSSVFRFSNNYVKTTSTDPQNVYGTYLTEKTVNKYLNQKNNMINASSNEVSDLLEFNTSLDVGYNKHFNLKFVPNSNFKPVIVTNKNSLEIDGSTADVYHYGNASDLTVTRLDGSYTEYGTIDGDVKLKSDGIKFVASEEAKVNTVIVESNNITIDVKKGSEIGTVATTSNVTTSIDDIIKGDEEAKGKIETKPKIEPSSLVFGGGFGTEKSPYVLSSSDHIKDLASKVNAGKTGDYYKANYKIIKDIAVDNHTPIGDGCENDHKVFSGTIDGCNNTITLSSRAETEKSDDIMGLIGFVEGNVTIKNINVICHFKECTREMVGGLISSTRFSTGVINISNVNVSGEISSNKYSGGLISQAQGNNTFKIDNCSVDADLYTNGYRAGGFFGSLTGNDAATKSKGNLSNLTFNGDVKAFGKEDRGVIKKWVGTLIGQCATSFRVNNFVNKGTCEKASVIHKNNDDSPRLITLGSHDGVTARAKTYESTVSLYSNGTPVVGAFGDCFYVAQQSDHLKEHYVIDMPSNGSFISEGVKKYEGTYGYNAVIHNIKTDDCEFVGGEKFDIKILGNLNSSFIKDQNNNYIFGSFVE